MAKKEAKRKAPNGDATAHDDGDGMHDRDTVYRHYFDAKQTEYLQTLVCDDVIDEHQRNPLGQHSEPLQRLLHHFSRMPMTDKYAVKRDSTTSRFGIIALSGVRGTPPRAVGASDYATVEDAYHGIFLLQIKDLMGT